MTKYKSFEKLNGKTLQNKDKVVFGPNLEFEVQEGRYGLYLNHTSQNAKAFIQLGIDERSEQLKLASKVYGYKTDSGVFPETKYRDYEALTRLALVFFAAYAGDEYVEVNIGKKFVKIDLTKFKYEEPICMELTDSYSATFKKNYLRVGCQEISYKTIEQVYDKAKELGYIK